jgi:hypothetical protein
VSLSAGIDSGGTSAEGLLDLLGALEAGGNVFIFHNANSSTFHPKIYLFKNNEKADVIIGSGNLTEGGLYTNYEASIRLKLDLAQPADRALLASVETALDRWSTPSPGICLPLDELLLTKLMELGRVLPEALTREAEESGAVQRRSGVGRPDPLFKSVSVPPAPKKLLLRGQKISAAKAPSAGGRGVVSASSITFLMTLQNTDVGHGQTTAGRSRRSPEIFVPIQALDANPAFWGWPHLFVVDNKWSTTHAQAIAKRKAARRRSTRPLEKMDRVGVKFRMANGGIVVATIWYNPEKVDIRIRDERLRSAGNVGDLLVLTAALANAKYDYDVIVVPPSDPKFAKLSAACNTKVGGSSKKRFGYA